jgi:hypothetical protein
MKPTPGLTPGLSSGKSAASSVQKQGDLLRLHRNVPGDAKPILVEADEITTWTEDGVFVLLLRGQVLVQQSVAHTRFQEGVAWVDMKRSQATGILHMDLYAEGQVRIDTSVEIQDGGRALLDLNTRGEFRVRAHRGKVTRQDRSTDPLVVRARGLVGIRRPAAAPAVVPVSAPPAPVPASAPPAPPATLPPYAPAPSVPAPGTGIRQTSFEMPASGTMSPASGIALAQATGPGPLPSPSPSPTTTPGFPGPPRAGPGDPAPKDPPDPTPPHPTPPVPDSSKPTPPGGDPTSPPGSAPAGPVPAPPGPAPIPPPSKPGEPNRTPPMAPSGQPRQHRILPRTAENFDIKIEEQPGGRHLITVTGGVILNIRNVPGIGTLDVEADRAVVWSKSNNTEKTANNLRSDQGDSASELEFYMAGHVILRSQKIGSKESSVIYASELYYDTNRNVMVALDARLEMRTQRFAAKVPQFNEAVILTTPELFRTSEITYEVVKAEIFSTKLPSDPGLKLYVAQATIEERKKQLTNLFGRPIIDPKTGKQAEIGQSIVEARSVTTEFEGIPVFYTPYYRGDARDPLGPLETINMGYSNLFGVQAGVGLNIYKLLGLLQPDGFHARLNLDYLSRRGPGMGIDVDYNGNLSELPKPGAPKPAGADPLGLRALFGTSVPNPNDPDAPPLSYIGEVRSWGDYDKATDILGGARPADLLTFDPPGWRGRLLWRQAIWDMPCGFNLQTQFSPISDRNFIEQYFKREWDSDPNQSTYVYLKQQQDNWAWAALVEPRLRAWVTETQWLPRLDAYLIGQSFFDRLTYNAWATGAWAMFRPSNDPQQPLLSPTTGQPIPGVFEPPVGFATSAVPVDTGRFSLSQELAYPFTLGPFKVAPYAKLILAEYTSDLQGNEATRVWGGGGVRASIPFTRLYPEIQSELFNLQGINHKIVVSGNYFYADTNEPYTKFAELDRLNDDASEQMLREFKPQEPLYNPTSGLALATSKLFDPQMYAIRRLVDNRIDTLDRIDIFQFDLRQRWQTKRGFPGAEHVVDWMVLDTSFSYFPQASRDNFGKPFSFLEYNYLWNIGDRTSLESTGWFDPQDKGPHVFTVGAYFNRPDRTSFYIGYREIEPVQSRALTGSVTYVFSPKYAMTFTSMYDFGTQQALTNSLMFTRIGSDLQVTLGFTYNPLQNNFGAIVQIVPSLAPIQSPGLGPGMVGR